MRLLTEESVSSEAIRNAATSATIASAVPSLPERFLASASEPPTRSARSAAVVTEAPASVALDPLRDRGDVVGRVGPHLDGVDPALAVGELLQLRELHVDVGGLAAERRAREADDRELLAARA